MTWLLGLIGGKIPAVIIGVLFLTTAGLGFAVYKMIQKNGAQRQEIGEMKADAANMEKLLKLKSAALDQSQADQARHALEDQERGRQHAAQTRSLNTIIEKLKAEVKTHEEQLAVDCLNRRVPGPILDHLFGMQQRPAD